MKGAKKIKDMKESGEMVDTRKPDYLGEGPKGQVEMKGAFAKLGKEMRFNTLMHCFEIKEKGTWRELTDDYVKGFIEDFRRNFYVTSYPEKEEGETESKPVKRPYKISFRQLWDAIEARPTPVNGVYQWEAVAPDVDPLYDTIMDWCKSESARLEAAGIKHKDGWDGVDRLSPIFPKWFGTKNDKYNKLAGHRLLAGVVQRMHEPGSMIVESLMLVGAKDLGKFLLVETLSPDESWYTSQFNFSDSDQKRGESIEGNYFIEVGEEGDMRRTARSNVKRILSLRDDGNYRYAYGKRKRPKARRCDLYCTTNEPESLLDDPSGAIAKRWWVVECNLDIPDPVELDKHVSKWVKKIEDEKPQFWLQALHEYRKAKKKGIKFPANMPKELKQKQYKIAERHRITDPLEETFDQILHNTATSKIKEERWITASLMVEAAIKDSTNQSVKNRHATEKRKATDYLRHRKWIKGKGRKNMYRGGKYICREENAWFPPTDANLRKYK